MDAWTTKTGCALVTLALGLATACGGPDPAAEAPTRRPAAKAKEGRPAGERAAKAPRPEAAPEGSARSKREASGEPPGLVLLVVLDTVRADHLSACGYDRPTTTVFDDLVEKGASLACRAYSPAPWTLPSHASFFTGLPVTAHGLQLAPESALQLNPKVNVRPLDPSSETLAEHFQAAGYQTLFLSGNPIIKAETGLHQGFDRADSAEPQGGGLRGEALARRLKTGLERLDASRPVFAFVNVYDAHDPYPAVPKGVDWLPPQPEMRVNPTLAEASNPFFRFHEGRMSKKEAREWLRHAVDTYDWGVHEADRTLGLVLDGFRDAGFTKDGIRLVVTSDHGEYLGEHGLMRHGGSLHEPVVRVPFLAYDNTVEEPVTLPEPLSAQQAFWFLRDGALKDDLVPAEAVSTPNPSFFQVGVDSAAVWRGTRKAVAVAGEDPVGFDLEADPGEEAPKPLEGGPLAERLGAVVEAWEETKGRPVPEGEGLTEALRAMGYVE